jgi:dUTPase
MAKSKKITPDAELPQEVKISEQAVEVEKVSKELSDELSDEDSLPPLPLPSSWEGKIELKLASDEVQVPEIDSKGSPKIRVSAFLKNIKFLIISPGQSLVVSTGLIVNLRRQFAFVANSIPDLQNGFFVDPITGLKFEDVGSEFGELHVMIRNFTNQKQAIRTNDPIAELHLMRVEEFGWDILTAKTETTEDLTDLL